MVQTHIATAIVALLCIPIAARAAPLVTVVPAGFDNVPGNAQGPAPLRFPGAGGSRTQQVYEADQFTNFVGPRLITGFDLRGFPGFAPGGFFGNSVTASDITIQLSTTSRTDEGPLQLSSTFSDNIGGDVTTVYTGALTLTTAADGTGPVAPFDYSVTFATPFLFDPGAGNLLLDVLIPTTATVTTNGAFGFLTFDTVNTVGDGVFSVLDGSNGAATSGTLSTAGAITRFRSEAAGGPGPSDVPAPGTLLLAGTALSGLALARRKRRG